MGPITTVEMQIRRDFRAASDLEAEAAVGDTPDEVSGTHQDPP
jgi:hypothetical protein